MVYMKVSDQIRYSLIKRGIQEPDIYKGTSEYTQRDGWHLKRNGGVEIFLGKNVMEAVCANLE